MITTKNIYFSRANKEAAVILNVNNVSNYSKGYMGRGLYILDVDMYIQWKMRKIINILMRKSKVH